MKGAVPMNFIFLAVLAIGVVAFFGQGLVGIASVFPGSLTVDGCPVVTPEFGRIECEPLSSVAVVAESTFSGDNRQLPSYVQCGDFEYVKQCDKVSYVCDAGNIFLYQLDSPSKECDIGSGNWCFADALPNGVVKGLVQFAEPGFRLRIGGCTDPFQLFWHSGRVLEEYIPFGLNVYDSGGKYRYNVQGCTLGDLYADQFSVIAECEVEGCEGIWRTDAMAPDDWVNYLTGYNYVIEDLDTKIIDNQYYCHVNNRYDLGRIETTGGSCFYAPRGIPTYVDCCPGMTSANSFCGDDYKWHSLSDPDEPKPDCYTILECPGQGAWMPDYSTPVNDIYRWDCVDGGCVMVERKNTQCTPPNIGCPTGWVCDPNQGYICVLGDGTAPVICGDGICREPYEDELNCAADCSQPTPLDAAVRFSLMWIVGTVIAAIVLFALAFLLPIPFLKMMVFKNYKLMIAASMMLGLLIAFIFAAPVVAGIAASLAGGIS